MRADRRTVALGWVRVWALVVVVVVLQVTVLDRLDGVAPVGLDGPVLLVVAVGLGARIEDAAVVGFGTGLALDLVQLGPFGQHSLVYCLLGLAVSRLSLGTHLGGSSPAIRAAIRAAVAAGATVGVGLGLAATAAAVVPMAPSPAALAVAVDPGSALVGAAGIGPLIILVDRVGAVRRLDPRPPGRWIRPGTGAATWSGPLSPIRRL